MRWFRDREQGYLDDDPAAETKKDEEKPVIFIAEETRSIARRFHAETAAPIEPEGPVKDEDPDDSGYSDEQPAGEENRAEREQRRRRRWLIPALAIALALALVGTVIWAILERKEKMDLITRINNVYDSAFSQVASSVNELDNKLSKLIISTGTSAGQTTLLLTDVWKEAGTAQQMLSQLPVTHAVIGNLTRFVNQVGDYSYMLERKTALGTPLDANDVAQLTALSHQCNDLAGQLNELYQSGNVHWPQKLDIYMAAVPGGNQFDEKLAAGTQDLPQLIYDGPFSDSKVNQMPKELPPAEVTADQAKSMALQALRVANVDLAASGDMDGKVPCYVFQGSLPNDGNALVEITKKGGLVYNMTVSTPDTVDRMPAPEEMDAIAVKAIDYLNTIGYKDMKPVYTQYSMGFVVVNCVYFINDVLYYPDMIKVWINVSNGQPSGLDAQAYILNHVSSRAEPAPAVTQEKVVNDLAARMEIDAVRLAVIPTPDLKERFCYEVHGFRDDEEFLVYIDALTGAEQQIFRILDTAEGKMSI